MRPSDYLAFIRRLEDGDYVLSTLHPNGETTYSWGFSNIDREGEHEPLTLVEEAIYQQVTALSEAEVS